MFFSPGDVVFRTLQRRPVRLALVPFNVVNWLDTLCFAVDAGIRSCVARSLLFPILCGTVLSCGAVVWSTLDEIFRGTAKRPDFHGCVAAALYLWAVSLWFGVARVVCCS
jgi:hypothetical protein